MGVAAKNSLQIIARAHSLFFYVNDVFLVEWQDVTYLTGYIAFLATTYGGRSQTDVLYNNLKVYTKFKSSD